MPYGGTSAMGRVRGGPAVAAGEAALLGPGHLIETQCLGYASTALAFLLHVAGWSGEEAGLDSTLFNPNANPNPNPNPDPDPDPDPGLRS